VGPVNGSLTNWMKTGMLHYPTGQWLLGAVQSACARSHL